MAQYKTITILGIFQLRVKKRNRRIETPQGIRNFVGHYAKNPGKLFVLLVIILILAKPHALYDFVMHGGGVEFLSLIGEAIGTVIVIIGIWAFLIRPFAKS